VLKKRLLVTSALAMLAMAEASAATPGQQGVPKPRRKPVTTPARWPNEPDERTALQREIAAWNAAVDRRKADKKLGRGA
jgi:hypothetical protein